MHSCTDAANKEQAFRPGNVDLPSTQSHIANPSHINMPDAITELDLFAPVPDLEDLLLGRGSGLAVGDVSGLDWGTSQILPDSVEESQSATQLMELEEDDLGLDLGEDVTAPSIEIGRRAETPHHNEPLFDDDLGLDLGLGDTTIIGDQDAGDASERNKAALQSTRRERESLSPLSELGDAAAEDLERTFQLQQDEDVSTVQAAQQRPQKRRKVLAMDTSTELAASQVKSQPRDRSNILLPHANRLPRDPMILALLNMQRTGGFVSSILGDGSLRGLAPELRGVLSLEVVRRAGDLKRKRPSHPADDEPALPADEDLVLPDDDQPFFQDDTLALPATPCGPDFDETTVPPVAPADSGPVSLATAHTVHMLRQRFAPEDPSVPPSPASRKAQSVLFADLCPARKTSRADATKLFFETLVLATKDAVRVQQDPAAGLGAELRIRAKRGLWGAWAEAGVGMEQEEQEEGIEA